MHLLVVEFGSIEFGLSAFSVGLSDVATIAEFFVVVVMTLLLESLLGMEGRGALTSSGSLKSSLVVCTISGSSIALT